MAVSLETTVVKRFSGDSADYKPYPNVVQPDGTTPVAGDIPINSIFRERDTGIEYRWDGFDWVRPTSDETQTQALLAIFRELRLLRALAEREHEVEAEELVSSDDLIP